MESLSLFELNEYIQRVFALNFPEAIWVHFELSNVKTSRGHVYFDCIEKDEATDEIIAYQSGAIWARQLSFIRKKLKKLTDEIISDGVVISAKVNVEYHPRYGIKMAVQDIDPAYTYGQLALEREKTIQRLEEQDLINANSRLPLPPVIQRIAIVSNENAAGYQDFIAQLSNNTFGYGFSYTLFESALQGKNVEKELPEVFERIAKRSAKFDLIVVIRGGGSKLDLSAFDNYQVALAIASARLPVWTGIGHEIDESVADLVSANPLKTPTAVANAIIEYNYEFEAELHQIMETVRLRATAALREAQLNLATLKEVVVSLAKNRIHTAQNLLESSSDGMQEMIARTIERQSWQLENMSSQVELLDPGNILKKGYAIIEKANKRVNSSRQLTTGDKIVLQLKDGKTKAKVE